MIDWIKSAKLNKCTVGKLKARFKKYPKSNKRIIATCDKCGKEREIYNHGYHDKCNSCANSEEMKKYYKNNPNEKNNLTNRISILRNTDRDFSDNLRKKQSESGKKRWNKPGDREKGSEYSLKRYSEMDDPRLEIVKHHYLYDDADLSKYTMQMTRSEHTAMHNRMRADGYEVPHINSNIHSNDLWGYY